MSKGQGKTKRRTNMYICSKKKTINNLYDHRLSNNYVRYILPHLCETGCALSLEQRLHGSRITQTSMQHPITGLECGLTDTRRCPLIRI